MTESEKVGSGGDLERVLADLRALSGDIASCAVFAGEGALLSSSHAPGVERERVAAMLAAVANLAERAARESGKGHASQVRVDTGGGAPPAGPAGRRRLHGRHDRGGGPGRPRALRHAQRKRGRRESRAGRRSGVKKLFGWAFILGALVGGGVALRNYARKGAAATDVAQITFDDGSVRSFASNTPQGEELADMARKLVETGV